MMHLIATFSAQFTLIDWLVVIGYLALTTWIGVAMAGRQATIRDFFLGGRKLPWYAVSGSIIATEISALTFVSVPWVVFRPGGNFAYLQLGLIGSLLARGLVALWLVPAYYEREIYSPYDYMGNRLGNRVRNMTTALFTLGGLLGQSARIYLTAEVLNVVMHDQLAWLSRSFGLDELAWAIIILGGVSVVWTLLGGMATVVWTDVVLFLAFLVGAIVALGAVVFALPGGFSELLNAGWMAKESGVPWADWGAPKSSGPWGKFTFFDFSADPTKAFTIWTAMIASTWGGLGAYGTDQLMAQRMFCCRSIAEARLAIITSWLANAITVLVALVGVGLFAYYQTNRPSEEALSLLREFKGGDRIFPVFVVEVLPIGFKGLIIAAILAAAISSVMGILTALSQTIQSAFYNPWREAQLRKRGVDTALVAGGEHAEHSAADDAEAHRSVFVGRVLVVFWAVALSLLAYAAREVNEHYPSILELGLSAAGYCGGALLAGFALSFFNLRIDGTGYLWSAPLSVLCIFALVWCLPDQSAGIRQQHWPVYVVLAGAAILLIAGLLLVLNNATAKSHPAFSPAVQVAAVVCGVAVLIALGWFGHFSGESVKAGAVSSRIIAFPWYTPIGSLIAFIWGIMLARKSGGAVGVRR